MKLRNRKKIKYTLEVLTGIHIGGNVDSYGIGGVDAPVIKNPLNNEPIIPGSSIKGKMRMLLKASKSDNVLINQTFGEGAKRDGRLYFSRFLFRDLSLTPESSKNIQNKLGEGIFTEIKAENAINEFGVAQSPRFIERVPSGAVFSGEIVVQVIDDDNEDKLVKLVKDGFELIENSYLGGSGSRGYGRVKITLVD